MLAVTQLKSDSPTPEPTQSIGYDDAYLVALQLRDVPDHELWQDERPVAVEPFEASHITFYDLRRNPVAFVRQPYHCLQFYLPRVALNEIAQQQGCKFTGELSRLYGIGYSDPVIRDLGSALLPALEQSETTGGLFLDHILHAIAAHVVGAYGESGPMQKRASGGLAPWQERHAKELMRANLGADVSLKQLADACGLSVAHFARAFRHSTGTSPHRWLREKRIDKAMALLAGSGLALPDIAAECGFADQSHFTRTLTKHSGISPGRWRRENARRNGSDTSRRKP